MSERRSIPTIYNGIRFRSKLEADWAMTFDHIGVEWVYEKEGHYFGSTFYLPDFYLPRSEQFVEVKAVWEPEHVRKAQALCAHVPPRKHRPVRGAEREARDVVLIRCEPDGCFFGWPRVTAETTLHDFMAGTELGGHALHLVLLRCSACKGWFFAEDGEDYRCSCCGLSDHWPPFDAGEPAGFHGLITPWPFVAPRVA